MLITILSKWNSGHCKNNVSSPMTTVYYLFPYQEALPYVTRDGCHKVHWTLALARPKSTLVLWEIEPKLRSSWVSRSASHFSDNKKGLPIRKSFLLSKRARDGDRTRDPLLGKEVIHHWATRAYYIVLFFWFLANTSDIIHAKVKSVKHFFEKISKKLK